MRTLVYYYHQQNDISLFLSYIFALVLCNVRWSRMFILRLFLRARLSREGHGRHGRRGGGEGWVSIQRFSVVGAH